MGYSALFDVIAMPAVASLTVNPTSIIGGATNSTATVTLSSAAPTGGANVALTNGDTTAVSIPSSVTVSAGSTSATFTATSHTVSSVHNATLTATYSGSSQQATLRVVPQPVLQSVALNPTSVTGATSSTGTLTLSSQAPSAGIVVSLSISISNTYNPPAASLPTSVTVAQGAATATFTVSTTAVPAVTTATVTASYNGANPTATLSINPPALSNFTLSSSTVNGGQDVTATFTLNGPAPAGGSSVALSCSNNNAASVPAYTPSSLPTNVIVLAGNTTLQVDVHTSTVNYPITLTFTAHYNATLTASLTLNQSNLWVSALDLTPKI